MAWVRRNKSLYTGFILILLSLSTIYACMRQAKSETAPTSTTATSDAPAAAAAPAPTPAPAPAAPAPQAPPPVAAQVQPPVQAKEKELPANAPLVAPPPVTGLPKFADPSELPEPGPPYNRENSNPNTAMRNIPKEATGVEDWVKAFKEEKIKPHESLDLNKPGVPPFMFDVEIPAVGSMPNVIFPHFPHTFWLDCGNCHPGIFMMKKGGNPISMVKIVNGEFCGRCHGRVAFPLANCTRCHVKPKS